MKTIDSNLKRYEQIVEGLSKAMKIFPYFGYLITFFPFVAILLNAGFLNWSSMLLVLCPFIPAMAAGFIYNTICDADKDPANKNPVTSGIISKRISFGFCGFFLVTSAFLFVYVYSSFVALAISFIYLFLWFAYSGIRIRIKESYLAPFVASFVLWTGGPIILLSEFNYFTLNTIGLIIGLFVVYVSFEINHTIGDYDIDLKYNCKTFSVRMGKRKAIWLKHIAMTLGYIMLLVNSCNWHLSALFIISFLLLFPLSQGTMIICDKNSVDFSRRVFSIYFFLSPFFMMKLFMVSLGIIVLGPTLEYTVLLLWLFVTDKRSFAN